MVAEIANISDIVQVITFQSDVAFGKGLIATSGEGDREYLRRRSGDGVLDPRRRGEGERRLRTGEDDLERRLLPPRSLSLRPRPM